MHKTVWNSREYVTEGFWGPISGSIDWCEANYQYSKYVAEMFNAVSNLTYIWLALFGVTMCQRERLPVKFALCYLGIAIVGVGSIMFHTTLRYDAQLLDELPMLYAASTLTFTLWSTPPRTESYLISMSSILILFNTLITIIYIIYPNPVFHQVAYASIQTCTIFRTIYLIRQLPIDSVKRSQILKTFRIGCLTFAGGFAIWNVDNLFCDPITSLKMRHGQPWAGLLEGHAHWHLLTGYGSFLIVAATEFLVLNIDEGVDSPYEMHSLAWGMLPVIVRRKTPKMD